jgi:hypothetical protein
MLPRGKKEKKGPPCPRCFREVAYGALLLKVALPCDTPYNTPSMTKKSRGRGRAFENAVVSDQKVAIVHKRE